MGSLTGIDARLTAQIHISAQDKVRMRFKANTIRGLPPQEDYHQVVTSSCNVHLINLNSLEL